MKFKELPRDQKLLFIAHSLAALAGFLASYAAILAMADQARLPNETKFNPVTDNPARDYFR